MSAAIVYQSKEARLVIQALDRDILTEEIDYRLELQRENEDYVFDDWYLALKDTEEWAENLNQRTLLNACRRALIQLGKYREITSGEIARTYRSGGSKVWDFQLGGKKYIWKGETPTIEEMS